MSEQDNQAAPLSGQAAMRDLVATATGSGAAPAMQRGSARDMTATRERRAARLVVAADVEPEAVRWLWAGRIPLGKLTILDGDPGLGKSTLMIDLAARLSTGAAMPDGSRSDLDGPAGTVFLMAEDGLRDTWRPRLDAAGADVSLVAALRAVPGGRDGAPDRPPTVQDTAELEWAVRQVGARLLVVDPLMAYMGLSTDTHRDQDVRWALAGLVELAERLGVAVVLIRHLNKGQAASPLYRGGGSIGLIAAARSGLIVAPEPADATGERRILAPTKSNLAQRPRALAYRLEQTSEGTRVVWEGETEHTAAGLLAVTDGEVRTALDEATAFLQEELAEGAEAPVADIRGERGRIRVRGLQTRARDAGIEWRTIRRAADVLRVRKRREGFGPGGRWLWSLPTMGDHQSRSPMDAQGLATYDGPRAGRGDVGDGRLIGAQDGGMDICGSDETPEELWSAVFADDPQDPNADLFEKFQNDGRYAPETWA